MRSSKGDEFAQAFREKLEECRLWLQENRANELPDESDFGNWDDGRGGMFWIDGELFFTGWTKYHQVVYVRHEHHEHPDAFIAPMLYNGLEMIRYEWTIYLGTDW